MKKRLLVTLEYPPDHGGIATYYHGLVGAMPADAVTVMTPRTHRFFTRWFWPHWLPLLWNVWRVIRKEKPDDIWIGQILPVGTVIWILQKILHPTPYTLHPVVFVHGLDILAPQESRWKRWLIKKILASADRVVANSEFTRREVIQLGVTEEKVAVVYPCVDMQKRREVGLPNIRNKRILLTVARLVHRKGIDLVLEALKNIKDKFPDLLYVIIGDGPERQKLELLVTRYSLPVTFTSSISDSERSAWYDACDLFIMTPRQIRGDVEGFGIVYLEAGLHGKPVIGSRSGGVPEAIVDGETGILVPENDVEATASAIERLLSNQSFAKKLGEQGRARVEKKFSHWSIEGLL